MPPWVWGGCRTLSRWWVGLEASRIPGRAGWARGWHGEGASAGMVQVEPGSAQGRREAALPHSCPGPAHSPRAPAPSHPGCRSPSEPRLLPGWRSAGKRFERCRSRGLRGRRLLLGVGFYFFFFFPPLYFFFFSAGDDDGGNSLRCRLAARVPWVRISSRGIHRSQPSLAPPEPGAAEPEPPGRGRAGRGQPKGGTGPWAG